MYRSEGKSAHGKEIQRVLVGTLSNDGAPSGFLYPSCLEYSRGY